MTPAATPLPEASDKTRAVERIFDAVAPRYELLNRLLTGGLDGRWRRRAVRSLELPAGSLVLDAACGTGDLCRHLAGEGIRGVGLDRSAGMLAAARTRAPLVRGDAEGLPFPGASFDGLVCGFALRNLAALEPFLAEAARVLRRGGRLALLEVGRPSRRAVRAAHSLYFDRVVPVVGGMLSDRAAYRYLPASTAYLPPAPELLALVHQAGFEAVARREMMLGAAQLVTGARR